MLKLTRYIQSEFARYQAIQTQLSNSPLVYEGLSASSHADGSELDGTCRIFKSPVALQTCTY